MTYGWRIQYNKHQVGFLTYNMIVNERRRWTMVDVLKPSSLIFTPVTGKARIQGQSLTRDPAGVLVGRTGLSTFNVGGTELMDGVALRLGLDPKNYSVTFGVNEKAGVVAIYPVVTLDGAVNSVRHIPKRRIATIHLGKVFEDYPDLRPSANRDCDLFPGPDGEGKDCIMIVVNGSFVKGSKSAATQAAPAKRKEKAVPEKTEAK